MADYFLSLTDVDLYPKDGRHSIYLVTSKKPVNLCFELDFEVKEDALIFVRDIIKGDSMEYIFNDCRVEIIGRQLMIKPCWSKQSFPCILTEACKRKTTKLILNE